MLADGFSDTAFAGAALPRKTKTEVLRIERERTILVMMRLSIAAVTPALPAQVSPAWLIQKLGDGQHRRNFVFRNTGQLNNQLTTITHSDRGVRGSKR